MENVRRILLAATIGLALAFSVNAASAADVEKIGMVTGVANKQVGIASIDDRTSNFTCSSDDAQKSLSRLPEAGDQVVYPDNKDTRCNNLRMRAVHVDAGTRLIVIAFGAAVALLAAFYATYGRPLRFLIGADGRYSNSQCQLALWFGMAMTMYIAMVVLRIHYLGADFIDGVALTTNVMTLTGLSAFTFGAAKAVTAQKVDSASNTAAAPVAEAAVNAARSNGVTDDAILKSLKDAIIKGGSDKAAAITEQILTDAKVAAPAIKDTVGAVRAAQQLHNPKPPQADGPSLRKDLFQNNLGQVDLGDFQMILIALAAAVVWGVSCYLAMESLPYQIHVSLPDVDSSLLAGFGIGQGAYLVKKAATSPNNG
jgi:hypothetical protein